MIENDREKWIITSAWPYVNATPHLGNMIGSVLSADVFARYLRLKGHEVVFVSGSDAHGTPVAVAAKNQGIPAKDLAMKNHEFISQLFKDWKISYDNYTHTHNPTHIKFVQDFYLEVQENGYIFEKEIESLYCENDELFLPDRFVEGICPHCGVAGARGDQCDNPECGKLLTPLELKQPQCAICGNTPIIKKTKHWYMDFPKIEQKLTNLIKNNSIIPSNARTMCLNSINEGLPERAITRDLEWGIPAPFKGAADKSIYVWFEAVLGYISAVKEWAEKIINKPKKFDYFWKDPDTKAVYFIGKDNIIFHLIIFPGLEMAYNEGKSEENSFVLPYNVSSTEFLMYENDKFSKSRNVGIWIDEALDLAPLDYWRFNLVYNRPEKSDTSFLWSEFDNNVKTLNDNIGNFIHRTLTFIHNKFDSKIPPTKVFDTVDEEFLNKIKHIPVKVGKLIEQFKLRKALREIVSFGKEGNIYLNEKAPWHLIKKDKDAAGHVFNICAQAVHALAVLLAPFIPDSSEKILHYLDQGRSLESINWDDVKEDSIKPLKSIKKPKPIFEKLDIEELKEKLKNMRSKKEEKKQEHVSYEEFKKLKIKVAKVIKVEDIPKADKLYKLTIDIGDEERTLLAGLKEHYSKEDLLGKKIVVLTNLEPKKMRGVLSEGMLLAAVDGDKVAILTPDKDVETGSTIE